MDNRRKGAMATLDTLKKNFIESAKMTAKLKIFLYKTYVRPKLYYGVETLVLNKCQRKKMQKIESTVVKRLLGISSYSKSTELIYAVQTEKSGKRLDTLKAGFFERILKNNFTRTLTEEICNFYQSNLKKISKISFIKEIIDITKSSCLDLSIIYENTFYITSLKRVILNK